MSRTGINLLKPTKHCSRRTQILETERVFKTGPVYLT